MRLIIAVLAASLLFSSARAQAPVADEREIPTDAILESNSAGLMALHVQIATKRVFISGSASRHS
jgi:hypothetical protein